VVKITVDGHPATLMTATSGPAAVPPGFFDGTVGCPDPADDKEEACFGIQPEWLLQLAVIPVGKTTLLAWALLAPSELIPPHTHAHEDQCICIVSGALCLQIGDELIQAPAGSYVIKPRGLPHAFWNPGTTLARVLEITSPGGFEPYYDEMAAVTSPEQALAVQAKYGITFHGDHAVELISHHGLRVGNIPQSWR
jgi:mannose-6-phosphate isomerase-like protein (cupin superfamily)